MRITPEETKKVARLARLEIADGELEELTERLSSILDYVSQLQEINTDGVEPLNYVTPTENVWGEDEVRPTDSETRDLILKAFPEREADLLKVKAVFK